MSYECMHESFIVPEFTFTSLFVIAEQTTNHHHTIEVLERKDNDRIVSEIDRHMSCLLNIVDNTLKNAVNLVMYAKRAAVLAIRFISSSLQAHCHRLPDTRSLQIEFTMRMETDDRYAI